MIARAIILGLGVIFAIYAMWTGASAQDDTEDIVDLEQKSH